MAKLDYEYKVIREASILTNSYVASDVRWLWDNIDLTWKNQLILLIDFTIGSLTSMEIKAEFSHNEVDYYQEVSMSISWWIWTVDLFEYTFDATWKYRIAIPIKDKFIKISAKWTWTVTSSSLQITSITWLA